MHLFTADKWEGEIKECDEGELVWVDKSKISSLPIWEGDKLFFKLLDEKEPFLSLKVCYEGNTLAHAVLNGKPLLLG